MRTLHHIEAWFEAGAAHVVLGTLAITSQQLLAEACARFPGAILANIATKDGYVMIDGWRTQTAFRPQDIVYDLQMAGVVGIIHFDIGPLRGRCLDLARADDGDEAGRGHPRVLQRHRPQPRRHGPAALPAEHPRRHHREALLNERFSLQDALHVAAQRETSPEPEVETAVSVRGIQRPVKVYLASYGFSTAVRWWNHDLRQAVTDDNPYIEMLIPQEDLDVDLAEISPREVQAAYEKVVDDADAVLVVLDGVDHEAWTGFECGYARARGKYLLGIAIGAPNEARTPFEEMCDEVLVIDPHEDRFIFFASIAKQINARLLMDRAAD